MNRCPRCNGSGQYPTDADSFGCYICGDVSIGEPLPFIEPGRMARSEAARRVHHEGKELIPKYCECGAEIQKRSTLCRECAFKARQGAHAAGSEIVITPRGSTVKVFAVEGGLP